MNKLTLSLFAFACILPACATATDSVASDGPAAITSQVSSFDMAMATVDELIDAGNKQIAIDRLTQLTGDPSLSRDQLADTLLRRGELRLGAGGFDTRGAVSDFEEIVTRYSDTPAYTAAVPLLETAQDTAATLTAILADPNSTRTARFDALMQLGDHQDAIDLMRASDLSPDNGTLVAMYHIGYLCEGDEYTGRAYSATDSDGTSMDLRFCDFGK